MKAPGLRISEKAKLSRGIPIITRIMASLEGARPMARGSIRGPMERSMMASGFRVGSRAMGFGEGLIMITILVNGVSQKHMGTECIIGQMAIGMRDNGG